MPRFCTSCGAQIPDVATFCSACGKPVTNAAGAGAGAGVAPAAAARAGLEPNVAGLLCYLPIGPVGLIASILFLVLAPYNKDRFIRFHAFQSLLLAAACFAFSIAFMLVEGILAAITPVLAVIFFPVWALFGLAVLVLVVLLMVKAYQMEIYKLPYIGDVAEKQANAV